MGAVLTGSAMVLDAQTILTRSFYIVPGCLKEQELGMSPMFFIQNMVSPVNGTMIDIRAIKYFIFFTGPSNTRQSNRSN